MLILRQTFMYYAFVLTRGIELLVNQIYSCGKLFGIGLLVNQICIEENVPKFLSVQSVKRRANLLSIFFFDVLGLKQCGFAVGKLSGFWRILLFRLISGWKIYYVVR